jgi:hypothetical protein
MHEEPTIIRNYRNKLIRKISGSKSGAQRARAAGDVSKVTEMMRNIAELEGHLNVSPIACPKCNRLAFKKYPVAEWCEECNHLKELN